MHRFQRNDVRTKMHSFWSGETKLDVDIQNSPRLKSTR